jgi:hypothetical protein
MSARTGTLTAGTEGSGRKGKVSQKNWAVLICSMVEKALRDIFSELQECGVAAARTAAEEGTATVVHCTVLHEAGSPISSLVFSEGGKNLK